METEENVLTADSDAGVINQVNKMEQSVKRKKLLKQFESQRNKIIVANDDLEKENFNSSNNNMSQKTSTTQASTLLTPGNNNKVNKSNSFQSKVQSKPLSSSFIQPDQSSFLQSQVLQSSSDSQANQSSSIFNLSNSQLELSARKKFPAPCFDIHKQNSSVVALEDNVPAVIDSMSDTGEANLYNEQSEFKQDSFYHGNNILPLNFDYVQCKPGT